MNARKRSKETTTRSARCLVDLQPVGVDDVHVEEAAVAHEFARDPVLELDARLHRFAQPKLARERGVATQGRRLETQDHAVGELDLVAVARAARARVTGAPFRKVWLVPLQCTRKQALAVAHDLGVHARDALVGDRDVAGLGAADRHFVVADREALREQGRRPFDHAEVPRGAAQQAAAVPRARARDGHGDAGDLVDSRDRRLAVVGARGLPDPAQALEQTLHARESPGSRFTLSVIGVPASGSASWCNATTAIITRSPLWKRRPDCGRLYLAGVVGSQARRAPRGRRAGLDGLRLAQPVGSGFGGWEHTRSIERRNPGLGSLATTVD